MTSCQQPVRLRDRSFAYRLSLESVITFRHYIAGHKLSVNAEANANIASNLRLYKSVVRLKNAFQDNFFPSSAVSTARKVEQQCEHRTVN